MDGGAGSGEGVRHLLAAILLEVRLGKRMKGAVGVGTRGVFPVIKVAHYMVAMLGFRVVALLTQADSGLVKEKQGMGRKTAHPCFLGTQISSPS